MKMADSARSEKLQWHSAIPPLGREWMSDMLFALEYWVLHPEATRCSSLTSHFFCVGRPPRVVVRLSCRWRHTTGPLSKGNTNKSQRHQFFDTNLPTVCRLNPAHQARANATCFWPSFLKISYQCLVWGFAFWFFLIDYRAIPRLTKSRSFRHLISLDHHQWCITRINPSVWAIQISL